MHLHTCVQASSNQTNIYALVHVCSSHIATKLVYGHLYTCVQAI